MKIPSLLTLSVAAALPGCLASCAFKIRDPNGVVLVDSRANMERVTFTKSPDGAIAFSADKVDVAAPAKVIVSGVVRGASVVAGAMALKETSNIVREIRTPVP